MALTKWRILNNIHKKATRFLRELHWVMYHKPELKEKEAAQNIKKGLWDLTFLNQVEKSLKWHIFHWPP